MLQVWEGEKGSTYYSGLSVRIAYVCYCSIVLLFVDCKKLSLEDQPAQIALQLTGIPYELV